MIKKAVVTVADYAAGLGLDAFKERIRCGIDEKKLKANFAYIESQRKYNDLCTLAKEIDF